MPGLHRCSHRRECRRIYCGKPWPGTPGRPAGFSLIGLLLLFVLTACATRPGYRGDVMLLAPLQLNGTGLPVSEALILAPTPDLLGLSDEMREQICHLALLNGDISVIDEARKLYRNAGAEVMAR